MGADGYQPYEGAPVAEPSPSCPSAPPMAMHAYAAPATDELSTEFARLGLQAWQAACHGVGLTSMASLALVEDTADLEVPGMPVLVKKQLVKRAAELRELHAQLMEVEFKVISEARCFTLSVGGHETVEDVRRRFPADVPTPHKLTTGYGTALEDRDTFAKVNVVNKSVLFVIPTSGGPPSFYVKTPAGAVVSVTMCLSCTIFDLIQEISSQKKCPPTGIALEYQGRALLPHECLVQVGAHEGCVFRSVTELCTRRVV